MKNIKHFFRFNFKIYQIDAFDTLKVSGYRDIDFDAINRKWATDIDENITSFAYPLCLLFTVLQKQRLLNSCSYILIFISCIMAVLRFVDTYIVCFSIILFSGSVLFLLNTRKPEVIWDNMCYRIIVMGNVLKIVYLSGKHKIYNLNEVKYFMITQKDIGRKNILCFDDNTKLNYLNTMSYWPLLRNKLEDSLEKTGNFEIEKSKDGMSKRYKKVGK